MAHRITSEEILEVRLRLDALAAMRAPIALVGFDHLSEIEAARLKADIRDELEQERVAEAHGEKRENALGVIFERYRKRPESAVGEEEPGAPGVEQHAVLEVAAGKNAPVKRHALALVVLAGALLVVLGLKRGHGR